MKSYLLASIIIFLSCQVYSQSVGINNTGAAPDPTAILDLSSPNQGFLMPRMDKNIRMGMPQPAQGLMVFDSTLNNLYFYRGNEWSLVGEDGPFKTLGSLIVQKGNYDSDFIVGYPILPGNGPSVTDNFFFFQENFGIFRAGGLNNSVDWHTVNNGIYSAAFGLNTQAKGDYSFSTGNDTESLGRYSVSFGRLAISTGDYSFSNGQNVQSIGDYAVSFGENNLAEGDHSTVMGYGLVAPSFGELAIGSYNTDYAAISMGAFYPTDRAFVVGGGDVINDRDLFSIWKDGKVSIGHGDPIAKLDIIAEPGEDLINMYSNGQHKLRLLQDGKFIVGAGIPNSARLQVNTAFQEHPMKLRINGFQRFFVDSSGWTVIGPDAAQAKLDIQAFSHEKPLNVDVDGSRKFFIDTDGQVIVGDAIPDSRLQVNAETGEDAFSINVNNTRRFYVNDQGKAVIGQNAPQARFDIQASANEKAFNVDINNEQKFQIESDGQVVVGKNTAKARLDVQADTAEKAFNVDINSERKFLIDADGQVAIGNAIPSTRLQVDATTGEDAFRVRVSGATQLVVSSNGGWANYNITPTFALELENSTTDLRGRGRAYSWNTYSDRRIKSNIRPLEYGLADLMKLKASSYQHHSTTIEIDRINVENESSADIGLIAQEVHDIIPEAVSKPADEERDLWTMDYTRLVPLLIKSIQEQQEMIEELRREIELLKEQ